MNLEQSFLFHDETKLFTVFVLEPNQDQTIDVETAGNMDMNLELDTIFDKKSVRKKLEALRANKGCWSSRVPT